MADPALSLNEVTPSPHSRCAFCLQPVDADPRESCRKCRAVYHPDCWTANDARCAVYGCEQVPPPVAPEPPLRRPVLRREPVLAPPRNWSWTSPILGLLIFVAVKIFSHLSAPPAPNIRSEVPRLRARVTTEERAIRDARRLLERLDGVDDLVDSDSREGLKKEADSVLERLVKALLEQNGPFREVQIRILLDLIDQVGEKRTELGGP